ncbi:amino acid ABC transporter permease [Verrucosispora sp. NA02020]|uniref:amino acid ABC transporter permease n=1 Tax=unclassified Micromonospora TaxID=2617518 RepID=UPI001C37C494|nr:amino acid ABC transporter permease [Verrucosispora sp. NA02020]
MPYVSEVAGIPLVDGVLSHLGRLGAGLLVTVELTAASFAGAMVLGTLLAIMRIVPVPLLRLCAAIYVQFMRNTPLLVLLVLFVFGLPEIGILYDLFWTVTTAMAMYGAALVAETIRSGIRTVPPGEAEAARALGMTTARSLRHVILPRAFRSMVQPLGNIFIAIALSSSLAAAVGVTELTGETDLINLEFADAGPTFLVSTALYLILTLSIGFVTGLLEKKVAIGR